MSENAFPIFLCIIVEDKGRSKIEKRGVRIQKFSIHPMKLYFFKLTLLPGGF